MDTYLFVDNLHIDATLEEIIVVLSKVDPDVVFSVNVANDRGLCRYSTPDHSKKALEQLNGQAIHGQCIQLVLTNESAQPKSYQEECLEPFIKMVQRKLGVKVKSLEVILFELKHEFEPHGIKKDD